MAKKFASFFLSIAFFLALTSLVLSRPVPVNSSSSEVNYSVSDGIQGLRQPSYLRLVRTGSASEDSCEESYGFLPCTTTVLGNIFLIVVYGYLMFKAANFLCDGSEILMEILGPGLIGGLFLPILSSLPDAIIILASGLLATPETVQEQVLVGIGLLAGSTVMLLTLLWGSCVVVGKCDIVGENSPRRNAKDTKRFSLTESGVNIDIWTRYGAWIMALSIIPFLIVQLPNVLNTKLESSWAILAALIVSISFLMSYCIYQVLQPKFQKRRIKFAEHKHVISGILKHLKAKALGKLFTHDGQPDIDVIKRLFDALDADDSGSLSMAEIRSLIVSIQFQDIDVDVESNVKKIMNDFDTDNNLEINESEFIKGISRWLEKAKCTTPKPKQLFRDPTIKRLEDYHKESKLECQLLGHQNSDSEQSVENPKWNTFKAVLMLIAGMVIAIAFADPLVNTVGNFSTASGIPSFFIAFVVLPLICTSDAVSALSFVRQKNQKSASLTFCQIYGSVTMRNVLSLSMFLGIVYFRQLTWNFYAEVLVILIVCVVMGIIASFRTTYPLWMALVAYALYPFSLVFVYVLHYVFGLS